ncbi:MAG: hypothetical protein HY301_14285 [Verrucomicrobia bacterium]|nr:hypothetical protein [Verrucomicrobiota bacterium]
MPSSHPARRRFRQFGGAALAGLLAAHAFAAQPFIYDVETQPVNNYVLLHLNTEANRTYTVEYADVLKHTNTVWLTLTVIPSLPFENHYVIADTMTNSARFYRLHASP